MAENKMKPAKKRRLGGILINLADGGFIIEERYRWEGEDSLPPDDDPRVFTDKAAALKHIGELLG